MPGGRHTQTIDVRRISKRELERGRALYPDVEGVERPKTRGDCEAIARPCPFVSCRYHLFLEVNEEIGSIQLNYPGREPDELVESCALDVAEEGGRTLEEIGDLLNVTRERIRQIEARAIDWIARNKRVLRHLEVLR